MFYRHPAWGVILQPRTLTVGTDPPGIFGANLIAWWAPEDGLPSGVAPDKSGHSHPLTPAGTPAVTVGTGSGTAGGGFPANQVYSFTNTGAAGSAGSLYSGAPGSGSFPSLGGAGAVFMVACANVFSAPFAYYFQTIAVTASSSYDNLQSVEAYMNNSTPVVNIRANLSNVAGLTLADGTNHIYCFAWDTTTLYIYEDNVLRNSASAGGTLDIGDTGGTHTLMAFSVGGTDALSNATAWTGQMGDVFVVNVTPNSTQRTAAWNYLKTKFGM